jgi:hypothetical protein
MIAGVGALARAIAAKENEEEFPDGLPYLWVITRDRGHEIDVANSDGHGHKGQTPSAQGTSGPERHSEAAAAGLAAGEGIPFRLYGEGDIDEAGDFSGEYPYVRWVPARGVVDRDHPDYGLLYEGLIYFEPGQRDRWQEAPVDDFGRPNDGYAEVRYLGEDGKTWVSV